MALLNLFFCLVFSSPLMAMPPVLQGRKSMSPDSILKDTSTDDGARDFQGRKFPQFMMQLYQNIIRGRDKDLSNLEHPTLRNLIPSKASSLKVIYVGNHWTLFFDMSSISRSNELKLAELRFSLPSFRKSHSVTVDIYHTNDGKEKLFMGSFKTKPSAALDADCKVFNLTILLQNFLTRGKRLIKDEYIQAKGLHLKDLEKSATEKGTENVDTLKQDQYHVSDFAAERIMLVVFAKEQSHAKSDPPSLGKKLFPSKYGIDDNANKVNGFRRLRRNKKEKTQIHVSTGPPKPIEEIKPKCKKVDMFVDFQKIGWGSWIVYPKAYNAYRCESTCAVPLNETENATNHSYIKSLLPLSDMERKECPSCVPVKMMSMSMLYYENEDFILRHHEEMIVEECGFKDM
ncbi:nodal homolog 3-B precursor [Xenopus laevis]|uniref:nodal homolog 3-B precursor n=1 Tax=Xenopus laevis TaxID=8355 RepID=UPI00000FC235|nr:nodal homolog 3-B precursor [Xenopus laevis]AAC59735.1 fugacin [Xenopus laevis]